MAKYTELFSEYLEGGGALPLAFDLIEGFSDLFKLRYCDCEIGYESEALFTIKLELKANLVMQHYADRIKQQQEYFLKFMKPVKTIDEINDTTISNGKQVGYATELPFNATTAKPSNKTETEEFTNSTTYETTRSESGTNLDENIKAIEFITKQTATLIEKCLKEFEPLFMKVY